MNTSYQSLIDLNENRQPVKSFLFNFYFNLYLSDSILNLSMTNGSWLMYMGHSTELVQTAVPQQKKKHI